MYHFKWKVIIAALVLSLCNSPRTITANINGSSSSGSSYYLNSNETSTTPTTTRRFAIQINDSDTFVDTTTKFAEHSVRTKSNHDGVKVVALSEAIETNMDMEVVLTPTYETHLERSSVIFGLIRMANESNVNTRCHSQLKHIQRDILRKQPWAMKVLDASGTKPSGFVFGQNFWLGSREACGAVQNPVGITLSKNFQRVMHTGIIKDMAPFDMDYRVIYLRHNSPWQVEIKLMSEQIIHIGLCLPSACLSEEIKQLTTDYVDGGLFAENDIYDIKPKVLYMKDLKLNEDFYQKRTFKMISTFVIFTAAMICSASFLRVKTAEAKAESVSESDAVASSSDTNDSPVAVVAIFDGFIFGKLKHFVQCFDIQTNYGKMFATKANTANEIPVINGLRSVCALWIMVFHVMWYMYFTVNNKTYLITLAERMVFQYVSSAPLLVDVFFTISGFLQTYNFMRNVKQMETIRRSSFGSNAKQFIKMLFHRYLRLAPLYLVIVGMVALLYAYISDMSVYHINERFDEICSKHWWRNLFFIQNLFDLNDLCVNWTWSLACEMQFFILATILLFTYAKHPKLVKSIVGMAFVATIVWSFSVGINSKFQLSFDSFFATGTQIYISPFVRVLPYLMGAVAGWYLREKQSELELSDTKEKCLWNLAIALFFICLYSTFQRDISSIMCTTLFVIGRLLFSMAVCWMVIGSATGRGSWWSRILEAKVFQHINRLSYAIYLLNPFVIAFFFSLTNASTHADPFMLCVLACGFAVIVYLASIVFSLVFEMPYCNWSSLLLKRRGNKQKTA